MSLDGTAKNVKRVSIDSKSVLDIQPVLYSFKGPPQSHVSTAVITATRPPQWLYHDHVMGVIWMIFHKEKNYVGISQLQWCLRFLLDLKNSQGEYTGDIEICIQAVQDDLIEQYARLGPAMEKSIKAKSSGMEKESSVVLEHMRNPINEGTRHEVVDEDTVLEDDRPEVSINDHSTDSMNNNYGSAVKGEGEDEDESFINGMGHGIAGTSTPKEEEPRTSMLENRNRDKNSGEACSLKCASRKKRVNNAEIVSFTYDEMVSSGPWPCTQLYLIEDNRNNQSIDLDQGPRDNLGDMNSSGLVSFLNSSKQQHVERINNDMATLQILERLLANMHTSGFLINNGDDTTEYPRIEKFAD